MIDLILSLVGGFKNLIIGGIGILGTLFALFWRGRAKREKEIRRQYEQVEKIRKQDKVTDQQIEENKNDVEELNTPDQLADGFDKLRSYRKD